MAEPTGGCEARLWEGRGAWGTCIRFWTCSAPILVSSASTARSHSYTHQQRVRPHKAVPACAACKRRGRQYSSVLKHRVSGLTSIQSCAARHSHSMQWGIRITTHAHTGADAEGEGQQGQCEPGHKRPQNVFGHRSPHPPMFDYFVAFSKTGVVLWSRTAEPLSVRVPFRAIVGVAAPVGHPAPAFPPSRANADLLSPLLAPSPACRATRWTTS